MNQLPWSVISPNHKCPPFQNASVWNLKKKQKKPPRNADEDTLKKKKFLKVVNNISAAEHYSLFARLGRTRKTLVREKNSRKSQIAPEEEPKRKSSVTGCQGSRNCSSPSHVLPEQTSVLLFSTQHSRRCSTPLLALSQWEGGLSLVASNLPHPVTAQLGTKDQPNFHVPLMIAEKSNR